MKAELIFHSQIPEDSEFRYLLNEYNITHGQVIAFLAIRTCYPYKNTAELVATEAKKYFGDKGIEGKRLFNHVITSGHTSTLEHIHFVFAVEKVSRSLMAQLTRHRVGYGFSVQSQRFVKFSSDSRSKGFEYVVPEKIKNAEHTGNGDEVQRAFKYAMEEAQKCYDTLIGMGVAQEDARAVLPNAAATNLVVSANLRAMLDFYSKRSGNGAQAEIVQLAETLRAEIEKVEPWTKEFFDMVK